jgi:hypothetical protein
VDRRQLLADLSRAHVFLVQISGDDPMAAEAVKENIADRDHPNNRGIRSLPPVPQQCNVRVNRTGGLA